MSGHGHNINPKAHFRFTPAEIAIALAEAGGVVADAARHLKCSRATVGNYIRRYPAVRQALRAARRATCDVADSRLASEVMNGNLFASIHYLKIYGDNHGWGDPSDFPEDEIGLTEDEIELVDDL